MTRVAKDPPATCIQSSRAGEVSRRAQAVCDDRLAELLADRATVGLDEAGHAELAELGGTDDDSFDLAAAAVALAMLGLALTVEERMSETRCIRSASCDEVVRSHARDR